MNHKYTLLDILTNKVFIYDNNSNEQILINNGIEIPMIQRDYAQGRKDPKTDFIRTKFLNDIYKVLKNNQNGEDEYLNLDFIYGYIENATFIPLDGQQRLTTLYIIHWFIAFKDDVDFNSRGLNLFSYKTRQSAKEFLKSLNKPENQSKIRIECNNDLQKLIYVIKNQPWYNPRWVHDPTVNGFLHTLKDVLSLFSDITFSTIENLKPLGFHFLKIDEYGLGDNLYIKMNARGKPLSDFENFKATFESIISRHHTSAEIFTKKIDGVWLDVFWKFSLSSFPNVEVEKHVEKLTKRCDYLMLEFIKKLTEYLFYKSSISTNYQFSDLLLEEVYVEEENLLTLIQVFDLISQLDYNEWSEYFNEIFTEKWHSGKIAINQPSLNLILKIFAGENFSHFENVIFFGWVNYITKLNSIEITNDTKDYLRIIRNYVNNINQKKKTSLDTELRIDYYKDIIRTIGKIPTLNPYSRLESNIVTYRKEYIQFEQSKYSLFRNDDQMKELIFKFEDHPTLRGLIFNFEFSSYSRAEVQNIVENFYEMYDSVAYQDIIRLLLCYGNYVINVGNSNLGDFKFFGQKGKWHRILASPDGEIRPNFTELFKIFSKQVITDWNGFIETTVVDNIGKYDGSWLSYCLNPRYKTILDHPIFTDNYEGRIEIFYSQSLNSYHHNPFVFWFRYHSPNEIKQYINQPASCAQYSNFSRLHLKNGVELEQVNKSWIVFNLKEEFNHVEFKYDEANKIHILHCENLIEDLMIHIELLNSN